MPQKLIRLTCESNDGVFDGLFDQDIHIKQDSEIAFQSLTMEKSSTAFNVNASNDLVTFRSKENGGNQTCRILNKTYEKEDRVALMTDITQKMNAVCDYIVTPSQMNQQWKAKTNEITDLVEIGCRPSPLFPLLCWNPIDNLPVVNTAANRTAPIDNNVPNASAIVAGGPGMGRLQQSVAGLLNESYMFMTKPFIKSTGSFRISLSDMTDGTANRPAFTIGMVDEEGKRKLELSTITLPDLLYAIQVESRNTADPAQGGYSYITAKGAAGVTQTLPYVKIENSSAGKQGLNDTLEIVIRNNVLQGYIHQELGGLTTLPASLPITPGANLYPVVFCHLANTAAPVVNNLIDRIQSSLDPYHDYLDAEWIGFVTANPGLEPKQQDLPNVVTYDTDVALIPYESNLTLGSVGIAEFLGYTDAVIIRDNLFAPPPEEIGGELVIPPDLTLMDTNANRQYTVAQGWIALARNVFRTAIDSESFLVDTQTFMLDSYDSYGLTLSERNANSGGSRRNILATIPVLETLIPNQATVRVVYEPNTLDYIAIKNRSDIITRQIRMRLLNARYDTITTAGLAAMTILIREPYTD